MYLHLWQMRHWPMTWLLDQGPGKDNIGILKRRDLGKRNVNEQTEVSKMYMHLVNHINGY